VAEGGYEATAFFIRSQGFVRATAARRISFDESLIRRTVGRPFEPDMRRPRSDEWGAGGLKVDGRLMADLGRIWQVSGRLRRVEREFADASAVTGGDDAFLGSAELASALRSCVSGWSGERAALISRLSNVARLSALAASSYEKTDAQLAAVLDKAMSNGTGG
jgi:hypothetical protein